MKTKIMGMKPKKKTKEKGILKGNTSESWRRVIISANVRFAQILDRRYGQRQTIAACAT